MYQDMVESIVALSKSWERVIFSEPELVISSLGLALVLVLCLLLLVLQGRRRAQEQVRSLYAQISLLEQRLSDVGEQGAPPAETTSPKSGPLGVVHEEAAASPVAELVPEVAQQSAIAQETAISRGLKKSRTGFLSRLANLFAGRESVDSATLDDLEELLILSDVGARCAADLVTEVRQAATSSGGDVGPEKLNSLLKFGIRNRLVAAADDHQMYHPTRTPLIVLVVGVNGVGKTTTVAKLATKYIQQGKKVVAVAADTFRAAAVDQLAEWSNRVGFTLVRGSENAKPSAVVYDGMVAAKEGAFDVVLIDTAGRLHTKSNLMQELEGVRNSIRKHFPDGPHETVLVLDGVSGQNALSQAREFNQAVSLTGLVVTKLDGTPKGGIIVAISQELQLPVFFVGVGEKVEDLIVFDPNTFVDALFEEDVRLVSTTHPSESLASSPKVMHL
ncbi:MAG: signal recognition particle-docking protein FtsY [Pseudomonadota bacterium]